MSLFREAMIFDGSSIGDNRVRILNKDGIFVALLTNVELGKKNAAALWVMQPTFVPRKIYWE